MIRELFSLPSSTYSLALLRIRFGGSSTLCLHRRDHLVRDACLLQPDQVVFAEGVISRINVDLVQHDIHAEVRPHHLDHVRIRQDFLAVLGLRAWIGARTERGQCD